MRRRVPGTHIGHRRKGDGEEVALVLRKHLSGTLSIIETTVAGSQILWSMNDRLICFRRRCGGGRRDQQKDHFLKEPDNFRSLPSGVCDAFHNARSS